MNIINHHFIKSQKGLTPVLYVPLRSSHKQKTAKNIKISSLNRYYSENTYVHLINSFLPRGNLQAKITYIHAKSLNRET